MKKCFWGAMFMFFVVFNVCADNALQLRQFIGGNALCGWYHNEKSIGTEVIYNNKPWLLIGAGPRYVLKKGENELKLFGYLALTNNVAKKHWPIEKVEADSFIVPKIGNWSVCLTTRAGLDLANGNSRIYWGEDYIGYQVAKTQQIQLRTEWKYGQNILSRKNIWSQSVGPGWSSQIANVKFNGYVGVEIKDPHNKAGWVEMMMVKQ